LKTCDIFRNSAARSGFLLLILGALLLVPGHGQGASKKDDPTAKLSELQSVLFSYADKYMSAVAQATFEVRMQDPSNPELRLRMHSLKLLVAATVQELVVSANPESTLLDLMVYATLHRMSSKEKWTRDWWGDSAGKITPVMLKLENEIWSVARGYMTREQIAEVRELIKQWKRENPDLHVVSYIRFSDFAKLRSKSPLVDKARSGGFLVDTSGAEKVADDALLLAERSLHYSKRLPWIIEWQLEKVFYTLAVEPEIMQALAQSRDLTRSLNSFATSIEKLPQQVATERQASIEQMASAITAERKASIEQMASAITTERKASIEQMAIVFATERGTVIHDLTEALATERQAAVEQIGQLITAERKAVFAEVDARQEMLTGTLSEVRGGLVEADRLAISLEKTTNSVNQVLITAEKLMGQFAESPEKSAATTEPFDIESYVGAIKELSITIHDANTLLLSTERLTGKESAMVAGMFDRVLWTGTMLIGILCVAVFITMLIYRAAARHIVAQSSFDPVLPPADSTAKANS
jgi:hypothetical protein